MLLVFEKSLEIPFGNCLQNLFMSHQRTSSSFITSRFSVSVSLHMVKTLYMHIKHVSLKLNQLDISLIFFIVVYLICNVVLISTVQQSDSVTYTFFF